MIIAGSRKYSIQQMQHWILSGEASSYVTATTSTSKLPVALSSSSASPEPHRISSAMELLREKLTRVTARFRRIGTQRTCFVWLEKHFDRKTTSTSKFGFHRDHRHIRSMLNLASEPQQTVDLQTHKHTLIHLESCSASLSAAACR